MTVLRFCALVLVVQFAACVCDAATPKEIDEAIKSGADYLKDQYKGASTKQVTGGPNGIGAAALAGLALLESGTPASHPSVKAITAAVRDSAFTTRQTYHITLCMLYLDKLGDPADVPLIQMLGVRLLAGQSGIGGWTYDCVESVPLLDERALRSALLNPEPTSGNKQPATPSTANPGKNSLPGSSKPGAVKLHPEVERYQNKLAAVRIQARIDDNSNTQFGVLGIWVARKYGVSVESALDLIEKRFVNSQMSTGGWPYAGSLKAGSPSMTCAGLLGLATAIGRREERMRSEAAKVDASPKNGLGPPTQLAPDEKTTTPKALPDALDKAVQKGLASVGSALASTTDGMGRGKGTRFLLNGGSLGDRDLYFLWSVERVGVIYGLNKIGGIDWYEVGAEELVAAQNISGSWGRGGRGAEVDTAFAILFLVRSNPALELSNSLQRGFSTAELRSGPAPGSPKGPDSTPSATATKPTAPAEQTESRRPGVIVIRPSGSKDEDPKVLAGELVKAMGLEWDSVLKKIRDDKGTANTQALLLAIGHLEGDRLALAREALAERLGRMTAETLRTMVKSQETELRRAAVLAMAMKDDKSHIPDLIAAILDDEDLVVRAAKAGLKSLTGQDFGPPSPSTGSERKAAAAAWKEWLQLQKKP